MSADSATPRPMSRLRAFLQIPLAVHAAAVLFASLMIGYLVVYPVYYGFDEPQHVDRIYATTEGNLLPDPGKLYAAEGIARSQNLYVEAWPYAPDHSYAEHAPLPRGNRPSLIDLGGHAPIAPGGYSNQMSQHPPAYYWLYGAVLWAIPNDAAMPVDALVALLRSLNIPLLLPVPYLVWWGVRKLTGSGWAPQAAAFVPALVPGFGHVGASVNNDNLIILLVTALLAFLAGVTRGDLTTRTAVWVSGLTACALLTKGNAIVLPIIVAAVYAVGWWRARGPFPWRTVLVVIAGGALGGVWWVRNVVLFGVIQPDGIGNRLQSTTGPPRQPGDPASFHTFIDYVWTFFPQRFWGGLGLIEPPALPTRTVTGLNVLFALMVLVTLVAAIRFLPALVILTIGGPLTMATVLQSSWSHYEHFTIIQGVQGRYVYPYVLGMAGFIAIGLVTLLGPARRLAPLIVLGAALVTESVAAYVVVKHIWLPIGQSPRPGNVKGALDTIAAYAPWPTGVTYGLVALVLVGVIASIALAVTAVLRAPRADRSEAGPRTGAPRYVAAGGVVLD